MPLPGLEDNRCKRHAQQFRSVAAQLLLADDALFRSIELAALAPGETAKAASAATTTGTVARKPGAALRIGIPRAVPISAARIRLADLAWQPAAGGGTAARIALTSGGALALRLGIGMTDAPAGLVLRFQGSGAPGQTFDPVAASTMPTAHPYWSPVLSGDRAVVELALPAGVAPGNATLQLPVISHLLANPGSSKAADDPYFLLLIGAAGSCQVDVACTSDASPALLKAQSSVARLVLTTQGSSFLCSGTLVNDSVNSSSPYVYMANHCIDDLDAPNEALAASVQATEAASSTNSYWFFHAASCSSLTIPNYVLRTGGAKLLARSVDYDWALLQLNEPAPSGAAFSAWRAELIAIGTSVIMLHHPKGDLTKHSIGAVTDYVTNGDGASYVEAHWTQGAAEGGSGGGGLFTLSPDGSTYELRGGLLRADSSCRRQAIPDPFSRLDSAIPLLGQYLTPNSPLASGAMPVVEFYNAALNDYFITIDPAEINDLDNGTHAGWIRTGLRFLAYPNATVAPAGASPRWRF